MLKTYNAHIEKSRQLKTAEKLWQEVICDLALTPLKKDYTVGQFTSRLCYLTSNQALTTRGVGKGDSELAIDMCASFEALEYFLSGFRFNTYPIIQGSLSEIAKTHTPLMSRDEKHPHNGDCAPLSWVTYQHISTQELFAVPLAMVDLFYQPAIEENIPNTFYAASNGLASGITYEDAVIHGALELIERDAYSYFLIDTYLLNKPFSIIKKETLPTDLIELINRIELNYHNEVYIFRMPSRFDAYVYLATFRHFTFEIRPRGAGASLNSKQALERAVYELIQTHNLMHGEYVENEINTDRLENNKLMRDFLEFNFSFYLSEANWIAFEDNTSQVNNLQATDYLQKLSMLINQHSALLVNTAYQHSNGVTCARVIIPDAEEFFLATHYLKLNPKPKTQSYIIDQMGEAFNW